MQRYPAAFRGEHYFAVVLADGMLKADRVTGPGGGRIRRLTRTEEQTVSQNATDLVSLVSEVFPGLEAEQRRLALHPERCRRAQRLLKTSTGREGPKATLSGLSARSEFNSSCPGY
jgi:hypothetical protein